MKSSREVNQSGGQLHHLLTQTPQHHRLSFPDHKPLRIGALDAILRQVATTKGITREQILAKIPPQPDLHASY